MFQVVLKCIHFSLFLPLTPQHSPALDNSLLIGRFIISLTVRKIILLKPEYVFLLQTANHFSLYFKSMLLPMAARPYVLNSSSTSSFIFSRSPDKDPALQILAFLECPKFFTISAPSPYTFIPSGFYRLLSAILPVTD